MLGLNLYFIRPLLPDWGMQVLSLLLGLAFIIYALYQFFWKRAVTVALCAPTFIGNAICGL